MEKWKRERDPEKEPLGFKFKLIHEGFEKNFNDQLKDENLTFSQMSVLFYLIRNQDHKVSQKELCEALHSSHPTVIGLIDRLQEKDMVIRVVDEDNHKYKNILLTPKAVDILEKRKKHHEWMEDLLVKGMSKEEIKKLRQLLDKVYENMQDI